MVGTGCRYQYPIPAQHLHGHLIQAVVSLFTGFHVFFTFNERRRIQHHDIELVLIRPQTSECLKSVALHRGHPFRQPIGHRVGPNPLHSRTGSIDADNFTGTGDSRLWTNCGPPSGVMMVRGFSLILPV